MFRIVNSDEILQSLQSQSNSQMSKFEGTFEYDIFSSNAIEFMKTYVELGELYKVAFADTSYGDFLTARAKEAGIIRKEATKAHGTAIVKGKGVLPKGSQFATADGVLFETVQQYSVNGSLRVDIQAVESGPAGNVGPNTITSIPMSIPGIISISNDVNTTDGFNKESDEALRKRYLLHVRTPGTSGNKFHYYEWAMSVPGVGAAKVIPVWDGPGTVKIVIVNSEFKTASNELVGKVKNYIESVRPMGAMVTVVSATIKLINIKAYINGSQFDIALFKRLVHTYFLELEQAVIANDSSVRLSLAKIGSLLLDAGAVDYRNLTLNDKNESIALEADSLPTLGEVIQL